MTSVGGVRLEDIVEDVQWTDSSTALVRWASYGQSATFTVWTVCTWFLQSKHDSSPGAQMWRVSSMGGWCYLMRKVQRGSVASRNGSSGSDDELSPQTYASSVHCFSSRHPSAHHQRTRVGAFVLRPRLPRIVKNHPAAVKPASLADAADA
jgi:hypothetical protein